MKPFPAVLSFVLLLAPLRGWGQGGGAQTGPLPIEVEIINASAINTPHFEFSPVYYEGGLVYVSSRYESGPVDKKLGERYFELFFAPLDGNHLPYGKPRSFSNEINTPIHEGPVAFSADANKIYFSRNNYERGAPKVNAQGQIVMKIYTADRGTYDWENITELPFNSDDYSCMHPALSADGRRLFFSSNMPGGYGGMDLYFVEKRADSWSRPINLGPDINTSGNEVFPFIHSSGVLFFASNGHPGYGGLDLFMIDISGNVWSKLRNLGPPFNSPQDDIGIILDAEGKRGFFASNRPGGRGKDDIYAFKAAEPLMEQVKDLNIPVQLIVFDERTGERIDGAQIRVFRRSGDGFIDNGQFYDIQLLPAGPDGELIMKLVRKNPDEMDAPVAVTNYNGEADLSLVSGQNYLIFASKEGFESAEMGFSTLEKEGAETLRIPLKPLACAEVRGTVTVQKFNKRVPNAVVHILNKCTGEILKVRTDSEGEFESCLPPGCDYEIQVEKEGYTKGVKELSTRSLPTGAKKEVEILINPIAENILREPIREGTVIVLENIFYDFNQWSIRKSAAQELDALARIMKQYPSMEIELIAHTDSRGSEEYNLELSLKRAEAAKAYLVEKGIEPQRIRAFGYGESQLRNHCRDGVECSEEEHAYNRRTEVRVTRIDEPVQVQYRGSNSGQNRQ
ncbi:MAG: hypothetical protein D6765_12420 [Bacteroidetes bacterium]|nr:MAG: hypothetical protein D6765_12420 [Bacteroidota bacterium]